MKLSRMPVKYFLAALLSVALFGAVMSITVARADQKDPRLDQLFAALQKAGDRQTAVPIERAIWNIWMRSDNAIVSQLLYNGLLAMGNEDYRQALNLFSRITEISPNFAEGWNKRATVLFLMRDYRESLVDCRQVLRLEPRHFGALSGLGLIHNALDNPKQALAAYRRVLEVHPQASHAISEVKRLNELLHGRKI